MEITVIARQALLYGHIIAFALALATTIREDVHLLAGKAHRFGFFCWRLQSW